MTENTYTFEQIHARHEALERMARDIRKAQADTTQLRLAAEPRAEVSDYFLAVLSERLDPWLSEALKAMADEVAAARAQLKRDATEAYLAFMEHKPGADEPQAEFAEVE